MRLGLASCTASVSKWSEPTVVVALSLAVLNGRAVVQYSQHEHEPVCVAAAVMMLLQQVGHSTRHGQLCLRQRVAAVAAA